MPDPRPNPPISVQLRPVDRADLPRLFELQLDPEANRMAAVIPRDWPSFSSIWERSFADPAVISRAITADGVLVGSIVCFKLEGMDAVGYAIDRSHWRRGIATRALKLFLDVVSIRPLHARAARHNVASLRVLQHCGFTVTGSQHSPGDARYLECEEVLLTLS